MAHFQAKWLPVRVKKMRSFKKLEASFRPNWIGKRFAGAAH
jgi:hypothetical protein